MKDIRILVVDDHNIVREGLVSILSFQSDIKVIGQAQDGQEGMAIARQEKPDIILLDLVMPKLDGLDCITQLREASPNSRILILTGYAEPDLVYRAITAGAMGYLRKDTSYEQLVKAIHDVNMGQIYVEPSMVVKLFEGANNVSASPKTNQFMDLTKRELQTLRLVAQGKSNQEIAEIMVVSEKTAAKYVGNVLRKLRLPNRTKAALYAIKEGLDKEK